ncbi:hypothetical protein TNCV_3364471 [Trichonephila clavipes]|nr:hypothetical protein TNCV_3364471 [Trichonephila clavipes]
MSSGYYMELDETAKARYDETLCCNGNKLPDPFDGSTMDENQDSNRLQLAVMLPWAILYKNRSSTLSFSP